MNTVDDIKKLIDEKIKIYANNGIEILHKLYENPELGGHEIESSELIKKILIDEGLELGEPFKKFPTSFKLSGKVGKGKPSIAFIVEYDGLPEIGHGCGHNASAAASVISALSTYDVMKKCNIDGEVLVIGTPGEETICSKVDMAKGGYFEGIDCAMMVHSYDKWEIDCRAMALDAIEMKFIGKAVHAAAAPEKGINALDALMIAFHGINCLREHIADGSRIHGIVTEGGNAVNVVPDITKCQFYIRSKERDYLNKLTERVINCGKAGALATGCQFEERYFEPSLDNIKVNSLLQERFFRNLKDKVSAEEIGREELWIGSTDMGNLSSMVPSIHPMMAVAPLGVQLHTKEFADKTIEKRSEEAIKAAAYALAATAIEIMME